MTELQVELVIRARDGDTAAFERVLGMHFEVAYAVALGIGGQPAEAEDICQDAFVRAWQRLDQCRDPARFRPWLLSVVRSVGRNRASSSKRRRTVPLPEEVVARESSPERAASRRELRERLTEAIGSLTEGQRTVLLLHDLEGFRHKEIAETMDTSEEMSRRYLSDARARMRELLGAAEAFMEDVYE